MTPDVPESLATSCVQVCCCPGKKKHKQKQYNELFSFECKTQFV